MTQSNSHHAAARQPKGVVHVLNHVEELQTYLGSRLDALIHNENENAKRADRHARLATGIGVAVATIFALACARISHS